MILALLLGSAASVFGEEQSKSQLAWQEVHQEWSRASNGRTDFELSDPALVPKFFVLFAKQSGCEYEADIKDHPIRFMRIKSHRLSIVFCRSGPFGSHYAFDLTNLQNPKVAPFPILVHPNGFGTTDSPGWIEYQQDAGVFQAEPRSDYRVNEVRYSYRYDDNFGFVVTRVELKKDLVSQWTTIWDSVPWDYPAR